MNKDFIYLYLSTDNIRSFPCLQPGSEYSLSATDFLVLLAIANEASWCANCFAVEDYNKYTSTNEHREKIKKTLNINDRTYDNALRSLVKNNLIYKVKKNVYILNSWIIAHGDGECIRKHREYCYYNCIFKTARLNRYAETEEELKLLRDDLNIDASKQKHACVYYDNLKNFSCFGGKFGAKRINITELILFFAFATSAQFVKYPGTIDINNVIDKSTRELEKTADLLQLKIRSVQQSIKNLCAMGLLHKIEHENGKYIINPIISAKGTKDKVHKYQSTVCQSSYFCGYANGDVAYLDNKIIDLRNGEVVEEETV